MPDGSTAQFPDGMSMADMQGAIEQHLSSQTAPGTGTVDGVRLPGFPAAPAPVMKPSVLGRDPNPGPVANFVKGAVKSIPATMAGLAHLVPGSSDAWQPLEDAAKTNGTAQAIGKGVGNAAQFLIPAAGEEKVAAFGASKLPMLGELAAPVAKMGASALGTGVVNKAQGGSFTAGALMGGASSGATQVAKAWAPKVMESALKVLGNDRMYGRTVGQAALDDTAGLRPSVIAKSAQSKIDELTPELESAAADASQAGARGSLTPARTAVQDTINGHFNNRAVNTANDIQPLNNFLAKDSVTGLPLSDSQTPTGLLRLKQGLDADHIGNWNPNKNTPQALGAARQAYGKLADEFHTAAPGTQELDQRISSLIPVAERANRVSLQAPTTQQLFNKLAAPTGALAAPLAGGIYGKETGGTPGMIKGAAAGMLLPAMLATPSGQAALARGLYSGALPNIVAPLLTGATLNLGRKLEPNADSK
jgi:hypothetical protein